MLQKTDWMYKCPYQSNYVSKEGGGIFGDKVCSRHLRKLFCLPKKIKRVRLLAYKHPGKHRIRFNLTRINYEVRVISVETEHLCGVKMLLFTAFRHRVETLLRDGIEKIYVECEYEYEE